MPLIIFKREAYASYVSSTPLTDALDEFRHRVYLPKSLIKKQWFLKSVNYLERSDTGRVNWVDIEIPQLMPSEKTRFALKQEGTTPQPNRGLRFYPNRYSMDSYKQSDNPITTACISTPNINLGRHSVEEGYLEMIISAKEVGSQDRVGLTSYELILEYN